jgi:NADPH:quinone reductase-like Zn-dependent oxidoreductase
MRAITLNQYGTPDVLHLSDLPKPIPANNQILIKMMATTVNSGDVRIRKADPFLVRLMFGIFKPKLKVLGNVISGIVEAVGKDVTAFKVGDEVFGLNDMTMGTYAECLVVDEKTPLALKPTNMNFEEAASTVFGGHTALHFLRKADVQKDQKVLIYGASGAVGSSAIQIAKAFGAEVTAVTSTININLVKNLGSDFVVDYTNSKELQDLFKKEGEFDIVYETVDKSSVSEIAKLVKPNGALLLGAVLIKGMLQGKMVSKKLNLKLVTGVAQVTPQDMQFLKDLAQTDKLKAVIDKTFALEQIPQAHEYVEKGHKKGNVVIKIG